MKTNKEITLVSLFGALYLGGVVGLGLGLPMVTWYLKQDDAIGPLIVSTGIISGMCTLIWYLLSGMGRSIVNLLRPHSNAREPLSNEKKLRLLKLEHYVMIMAFFVFPITLVSAFVLFLFRVMTTFSLLHASLVAIWFEAAYFVFLSAFRYVSDNMLGTNSSFRAEAFAALAQELLKRKEKGGLRYLGMALRIVHGNFSNLGFVLKDYETLVVTLNLCYQHETAVQFEYFASLASTIAEVPSYEKISNETKRILSLDQILWTHMYEAAKGSWLILSKMSLYVIPILALLLSLLTEDMRKNIWRYVETAGAQGWRDIILASATYLALPYAFRPVRVAFPNYIPRKHLSEMEHVWQLNSQKAKN